ncbi:MAG: HPr family phosphocarrier protein [Myxococcaceae bacterium]
MSTEAEGTFDIVNQLGLHARAAAQLVKVANRYPCEVLLECEGQQVNGKSIMGVLMLAAAMGMKVTVKCKGEKANECLAEIAALIADKFGEGK